jgi:hypothetical protein
MRYSSRRSSNPYINTSVEEGTWNYVDQKVQNAQKEIIFSIENTSI